ncbi:MAG: flavin reductase family protein [Prevotellaceae bacterium]|jgi:flavin reductase (DIM6/NTAB) family NADH-FMN oxidoreductase RutF|nr:flavin reductase family protein [Prevotellaceae bacterium]
MKNNILTVLILTIMAGSACVKHQKADSQVVAAPDTITNIAEGKKGFQKIGIRQLNISPDSLFSAGWFVVSAGDSAQFNEMTISWGALGTVWGVPAATIYIRNTRYTFEFLERGKYFVLNAFPEQYRGALELIGSKSGRDIDKVAATGLTPRFTELGNPYFDEAWLVIECEKIYRNDIDRNALFEEGQKMYSADPNETHRMYIGKVLNVWEKK